MGFNYAGSGVVCSFCIHSVHVSRWQKLQTTPDPSMLAGLSGGTVTSIAVLGRVDSVAFRTPVVDRHRTLENYAGVLLGARFELTEFLEPVATEEEVRQSARL